MTDDRQTTDEATLSAWREGVFASPPGRVESLTPANISRERHAPLIDMIRLGGPMAQMILGRLSSLHSGARDPWFALWQEHCGRHFDLDAAEAILAADFPSPRGARLFLAQSYGGIVLTEFAGLAAGRAGAGSCAGLYGWIDHLKCTELDTLRRNLRCEIAESADPAQLGALECSDLLAAIYQEMFPPALRHLLGEYYTPSWLVEYCIGQVQRHRPAIAGGITILDPAAGSGGFLAHAIVHAAATAIPGPATIAGFDVNPLAVEFCRVNTWLAALKTARSGGAGSFDIQIRLADAILDPITDSPATDPAERLSGASPIFRKKILGTDFSRDGFTDADLNKAINAFHLPAPKHKAFKSTLRQYVSDTFAATRGAAADIIVGNPPWIAWDGLASRYRDSLAPQWAASTLTVNTGWRAKVAAGKTDVSSLFVYRAAERHAAAHAVMVFVLPLSLFRSHLAGAGFRTFRTAADRRFALVELDDFSAAKVFPDAVNRTSVGTFVADKCPQFPIRYATWLPARGCRHLASVSSLGGPLVTADPGSPIVAFGPGHRQFEMTAGRSDYRARGGVNTGGANPILWVDVVAQAESTCTVRNVGTSRRRSSPVATAEVEHEAVWPLLRGADMRRWRAAPSRSILLLYSPDQPKKALPPAYAQSEMPKAYAFASRFREQLESRKEYHRWGGAGPFYEVYRIGPYTFSPVKVAWQHTGYRKALNVSVVDDRGRRPAIPDQKVILIPFDDVREAHYVCAFLSSSVTAALLDRYLGADASTHILDYVALRKFVPHDGDHRRLADLSALAHQAAAAGTEVAPFETEIDAIVARLQRSP